MGADRRKENFVIRDASFQAIPGICLMMGPPGSGKTTLATALAKRLKGRAVSLGELIRTARVQDHVLARDTEAAMQGDAGFDPSFLANLLISAGINTASEPIFLDAGPGIARALAHLDIHPTCVLWLCATHDVRLNRFKSRQRDEGLSHSATELFQKREHGLKPRFQASFERLAKAYPVFLLSASGDKKQVLTQALQALTLAACLQHSEPARRSEHIPLKEDLASQARRMVSNARSNQQAEGWIDGQIDLVALVKPGAAHPEKILPALVSIAKSHGFDISALVAWPAAQIKSEGRALAHLGLHAVYARFPELLTEITNVVSAFDQQGMPNITDQEWVKSHRTRLKPGAWIAKKADGKNVVNGYVPPLMTDFHAEGAIALAIGLAAHATHNGDVMEFRTKGIGASNSDAACPGSLRHGLYHGLIDIGLEPAAHRNGVHLSASSVEAQREAAIWFGPRALLQDFSPDASCQADSTLQFASRQMIDYPMNGSSYTDYENKMWTVSPQMLCVPPHLLREGHCVK